MKCPRCKTILCRIQYEGVPICTCPDCKGEFVDTNRLRVIEKRQGVTFEPGEAKKLERAETGPADDRRIICPRCGSSMRKGKYRGTDVVVDLCRACKGLWLDDQELEKIQVLAEKKAEAAVAALANARTAAAAGEGQSTDGQGYLPEASLTGASMSSPSRWARGAGAGAVAVVLALWVTGIIEGQLGIGPDLFGRAGAYIPHALGFLAVAIVSTFTRVALYPNQQLEVTRFVVGLPWVRRYLRDELACLGTDYRGPGILMELLRIVLWRRRTLFEMADVPEEPGRSYLYVVLKTGKKICVYKGTNEARLGEIADFLQAGLGLSVERL